jgi:hypothetical protein
MIGHPVVELHRALGQRHKTFFEAGDRHAGPAVRVQDAFRVRARRMDRAVDHEPGPIHAMHGIAQHVAVDVDQDQIRSGHFAVREAVGIDEIRVLPIR